MITRAIRQNLTEQYYYTVKYTLPSTVSNICRAMSSTFVNNNMLRVHLLYRLITPGVGGWGVGHQHNCGCMVYVSMVREMGTEGRLTYTEMLVLLNLLNLGFSPLHNY